MSAFSTTFSDFCAGNTGLPQVLSALREDLVRNRQALFDDSALIDWAWRSGRVDREVYQALRDTITNFDLSTPQAANEPGEEWPVIRATKYDLPLGAAAPDQDEPTRFRSSLRTSPQKNATRPSAPFPSNPSSSSSPWLTC